MRFWDCYKKCLIWTHPACFKISVWAGIAISVFTLDSQSSKDMCEYYSWKPAFNKLLSHSTGLPHNGQFCSHFPSPPFPCPYFSTYTGCAHLVVPLGQLWQQRINIFCIELFFCQFSKVIWLTPIRYVWELVQGMQSEHWNKAGRREQELLAAVCCWMAQIISLTFTYSLQAVFWRSSLNQHHWYTLV